MKNLFKNTLLAGVLSVSSFTLAEEHAHKAHADQGGKQPIDHSEHGDHSRHQDHDILAPVGIMSDHTHEAGGGMLSYRYMHMSMSDNYIGSDKVSDAQIISPSGEGYMVTPTSMEMDMHMLGAMWAPHDEVTLMLMLPYLFKSMDHLRRDGLRFNTASDGFSDLRLSSLIEVMDIHGHRINLNLGISAPTGSITEKGFVPGPGNTQLPYPMQMGSGTWDLLPGLTYLGEAGQWSWGAQFLANIRLDSNSQGYRLGNEYSLTTWGAYRWSDWISTSLRVVGTTWDDIHGNDKGLVIPAGAVPTADPGLRGGDRVDILAGINIYLQDGLLKGHRLALEVGGPVYQDLHGPQLGNDWMLIVGWQKNW